MRLIHILQLIACLVAPFSLASFSVQGQLANDALKNQVGEFADQGSYDAVVKIVEAEENQWKAGPSIDYFRDMSSIGQMLLSKRDARFYWLGRKVVWKILLKPTPNDRFAVNLVTSWKDDLLFSAEDINNAKRNPEMYAAIRHDTFLMFAEYARQANATIIPGYQNKFPGATFSGFPAPANWPYDMNKEPYKQNRIDNLVQTAARNTLEQLKEQTRYLIEAYSTEPRNDEELRQLLDILNIQGANRKRVMDESR